MRKLTIPAIALALTSIGLFTLSITSTPMSAVIYPITVEKEKIVVREQEIPLPPEEQMTCLAQNIYFESMQESFAGQVAVVSVVLNRVADSRFPNTICDVVWQQQYGKPNKGIVRNRCQFSWTCDGKSDQIRDKRAWGRAVEVAEIAYRMYNEGFDITEGATHYHATYVRPAWRRDRGMIRIGKVDTHIFYRWKG